MGKSGEDREEEGSCSDPSSGVVFAEGREGKFSDEAEWNDASEAVDDEIFSRIVVGEFVWAADGTIEGDAGRRALNHEWESI